MTEAPPRSARLILCFCAVVIAYTDRVNLSVAAIPMQQALHWSPQTKGLVLSAFFIGYLFSLLPSGWLATHLSGEKVLLGAVLGWSMLTLATPAAAAASLPAVLVVRIGLGVFEGALFPACYQILTRWVGPLERSRATIRLTSGIPVGQVGGLALSGWLVSRLGWASVFYMFGSLGLVWIVPWLTRISSGAGHAASFAAGAVVPASSLVNCQPSPVQRPIPGFATAADQGHALTRPGATAGRGAVGWRPVLRYPPVWAAIFALFCGNWGLYFLLTWLPSFFLQAHGMTIASAGVLSAAPWASYFVCGNVAAMIADRAGECGGGNISAIRKLSLCPAFVLAAVSLFAAQSAATAGFAVVLLCIAAGGLAVASSAYSPNFLELVPDRAAVLIGFGNTIATLPGIAGVAITGWIVQHTGSYTAAFALSSLLLVGGALVYGLWGSGRAIESSDSPDQ